LHGVFDLRTGGGALADVQCPDGPLKVQQALESGGIAAGSLDIRIEEGHAVAHLQSHYRSTSGQAQRFAVDLFMIMKVDNGFSSKCL